MSDLTKRALLSAFGMLLKKKPFNKITVTDITKECGVNRMTFYYHFQDIYELMMWGFERQVLEASGDFATYDSWKTGYLRLFYFALDRKNSITKIFLTLEEEHLEQYLNKIAQNLVFSVIDDKCNGRKIKQEDRLFAAQVCSNVLIGVLMNWIKCGMVEQPECVVKKVGILLDGMIEKAINGFE